MINTERCLIAICKIFARRKQRSRSTVSRPAAGSGETIARRAARVVRYLSEHRPADPARPAGLPRPKPAAEQTT